MDQLVSDFHIGELKRLEPIKFDCPWDWKLSAENVMEFYHYPGLHSETVGALFNIPKGPDDRIERLGKKNLYALGIGKPYAYSMQSSKHSFEIPNIPAFDVPDGLSDKQIGVHVFPNTSMIITPTFVV